MELFSDEFWSTYFPDAKSPLTKANNMRYINKILAISDQTMLVDWITSMKTFSFKHYSSIVKKLNGIYLNVSDENLARLDKRASDVEMEIILGDEQLVRPSNDPESIQEAFGVIQQNRVRALANNDISVKNLFGYWLPPRRLDVYRMVITNSDTEDKINYYNNTTRTFHFADEKNKRALETRSIKLTELAPLYLPNDKETFRTIVRFMDELPLGDFCPWKTYDRYVIKNFGYSNSTLRKFWVTRVTPTLLTVKQRLLLGMWMNHSENTKLRNYTIL